MENIPKKLNNIKIEKTILLKSVFNTVSILLKGRKPPDEIIVNARLNESKVLKFIIFKTKKIKIVKNV
tara:strand:+ start:1138 stop:1341 length:204 start_codon:yes stop_codon:yes gene_type:complete